MKKLRWISLLLVIISLLSTACGTNGAQETFDTAKLEELQNNSEHALILYQEIVEKYPSSPLAEKAKERIKVLEQGQ